MQPTFISDCQNWRNVKLQDGLLSLRFPNIQGILKADELRGFLADASDDKHINNPLSLFQVVPKDFLCEDNNGRMKEITPQNTYIRNILGERKIVRIDPGKLYSNFHCCDLFRKCNKGRNELLCYESDSRIALLYHPELVSINLETDFESYCQKLDTIIQEYNKTEDFLSEETSLKVVKYETSLPNKNGKKFLYVKYKCLYSRLEEFFFPIIFAGRVVAVLMQGQRFTHGMKKEDVFKGHIDNSKSGRKLRSSIDNLAAKYFNESPMSEKRLDSITERILRLEKKINDEIYIASQSYISDRFSYWQQKLRNKIKEIDINSDDALIKYNNDLSQILKEIFEEFHDKGFIRIYTLKRYDGIDYNMHNRYKFELIGDSSCIQSSQYRTISFSYFPFTTNVIEKEELLKYIIGNPPANFNKEKDIFRMEIPFMSQKAYIIWKRYDCIYSGEQKNHNDLYKSTLKSFYPTLLEPFFILEGAKLEKQLEASMRISVHESAQIIPSVISAINNLESQKILDEGKDYNGDPIVSKHMYTILDASHRLLLLEGLFKRSTLIFKKDPPKLKWCDFHRIIYSTKSLFDDRVYRAKCQSLQVLNEGGFSKYHLYTDYAYLSHVLFNLVDNAVKYGRKGTKIYLKVVLESDPIKTNLFNREEITCAKISVISFGNEIQDYERIFDLYYRNASKEVEGMGIGLFLAKKICNSLEYRVDCLKSFKVSDINQPMYFCYRNQNDLSKANLSDFYKRILKREYPQGITKLVVNEAAKDNWEVTETEIEKLLELPIYQNEFQITIPIKMNENLRVR